MKPYRTSELDIASYLIAAGHALVNVAPAGAIVEFVFNGTDGTAAEAVASYLAGDALPVREVFRAHRHLRSLIRQCKQNTTYRTGATHERSNS
jgi:hypothetical protein